MAVGDFFKRVLVSLLERPTSSDLNRLQTRLSETDRYMFHATFDESYGSSPSLSRNNALNGAGPQGFVGSSFYVMPNPASTPYGLLITPGIGVHRYGPVDATSLDGDVGADWTSGTSPIVLSDFQSGISVPSVPSVGHSRIDIIEVRANYRATEPATVGIWNVTSSVFDPTVRNKSFDWDLRGLTGTVTSPANSTAAISYKIGVDHTGGISGASEPATSPGYVKIARINLDGAVGSITQALIADLRRPLLPSGTVRAGAIIDIPGIAAGIGTEALVSVNLPQTIVARAGFVNNIPPSAGDSYTMRLILVGGEIRSPTALPVVGTSIMAADRYATIVGVAPAAASATDVAMWSGADPTFTVVGGDNITLALGQPYIGVSVMVRSMSGGALNNTERLHLTIESAMS